MYGLNIREAWMRKFIRGYARGQGDREHLHDAVKASHEHGLLAASAGQAFNDISLSTKLGSLFSQASNNDNNHTKHGRSRGRYFDRNTDAKAREKGPGKETPAHTDEHHDR